MHHHHHLPLPVPQPAMARSQPVALETGTAPTQLPLLHRLPRLVLRAAQIVVPARRQRGFSTNLNSSPFLPHLPLLSVHRHGSTLLPCPITSSLLNSLRVNRLLADLCSCLPSQQLLYRHRSPIISRHLRTRPISCSHKVKAWSLPQPCHLVCPTFLPHRSRLAHLGCSNSRVVPCQWDEGSISRLEPLIRPTPACRLVEISTW